MKHNETVPYADRLDLEREGKLPFFATQAGKTLSALLMVAIILIVLALQLGGSGSIAYEIDGTQLAVVCMNKGPLFIPLDTIEHVQLVESFQMGRAIETEAWDAGWCGTYENEAYGAYTLYAYSNGGGYIVVEYENGVLIFNSKTQKATERACEKLLERMAKV